MSAGDGGNYNIEVFAPTTDDERRCLDVSDGFPAAGRLLATDTTVERRRHVS